MKDPTKSELKQSLAARDGEITGLKQRLSEVEREANLRLRDAQREEGNARQAQATLAAGRHAVTLALAVKYGKNVESSVEWFRGQAVEEEGINEEVRFLRHLHSVLSGEKLPF